MRGAWLWRAAALLLLPVGVNSAAAKDFKFQSDVQADSLQAGDLAGAATAVVTADTDGKLTRAATLGDAFIDNNITASNYLPLAGGSLSGELSSSSNISGAAISGSSFLSSGDIKASNGAIRSIQTSSTSCFVADRYVASGSGPYAYFRKSRGLSEYDYTACQSGDFLMQLLGMGAYGSGFGLGCTIIGIADGTFASGSCPTKLSFRTSSSGSATPTERLVIGSDGNVSLSNGLTAASTIESDGGIIKSTRYASAGNASFYRYANSTSGAYAYFYKSRGSTENSYTAVQEDDYLMSLGSYASTGSGFAGAASIMAIADGDFSSTSSPGRLSFRTTPSGSTSAVERMVINSSGAVSITSDAAVATIDLKNNGTSNYTYGMKITCGPTAPTAASPSVPFMFYKNDGNDTLMGWVSARSDFIGFAWVSDERFKEDIEPTQLDAKNVIKNINVIDYRYNQAMSADGDLVEIDTNDETPVTGFSAQNLLDVYPQAVCPMPVKPSDESSTDTVALATTTDETYYGVSPTALIPVLVKQAQDQQSVIEDLETEVEEQRTKNDAQQVEIDDLKAQLAALTKTVEALASR